MKAHRVLTEESIGILQKLHKKKQISDDELWKIMDCTSHKAIVETFQELFNLKEEDLNALRKYIWNHWKGFSCEDDKLTMMNEHDCFFMKELLMNNGVLVKNKIERDRKFHTFRYVENSAKDLQDMEYIIKLKLNNFGVIYILDPGMLKEAKSL